MKKSCLIRLAVLISACFLLSTNGWSYYFFVLYNTSTGPFNTPIAERFDLNALVNNTVPFFISDAGPAVMAPGDSFHCTPKGRIQSLATTNW